MLSPCRTTCTNIHMFLLLSVMHKWRSRIFIVTVKIGHGHESSNFKKLNLNTLFNGSLRRLNLDVADLFDCINCWPGCLDSPSRCLESLSDNLCYLPGRQVYRETSMDIDCVNQWFLGKIQNFLIAAPLVLVSYNPENDLDLEQWCISDGHVFLLWQSR